MDSHVFEGYRQALNRRLDEFQRQQKAFSSADEQRLISAIEKFLAATKDLEKETSLPQTTQTVAPSPHYQTTKPLLDILNVVPDGHVVTSPKGIIQMANQQAAQLLNVSDQQLPDLPIMQFIAKQERPLIQSNLEELERGATSLIWEMQVYPHDSPSCPVSCTISALHNLEGELVLVHWLLRDLTEQQRTQVTEELVREIGEQVLTGLTLDQALSLICRRLVETFDYPLIWVGTKELDGGIRIRARASRNIHDSDQHGEQWDHTSEGRRAGGMAIRHKATQLIRLNDSDCSESAESLRFYGCESGLAIPLFVRDQVFGVLMVYAHQAHAFDSGVIQWLEKLAAQISMTLFVAQDYDKFRLHGAALTSAEHAVCLTDAKGRIEWLNDAYSRLTGYSLAEIIGKGLPSLLSSQMVDVIGKGQLPFTDGQCWKDESVEQRKDGSTYMVEQTVTPLMNDQGKLTNFVVVIQDITVRKQAEQQMRHRAYHDPLTDLPNRVMFEDRLNQALAQARRYRRFVSVMFIDLDRFKGVNDRYGHKTGDELLRAVGDRLKHCVRATDTVARLSGDEFTLILQDLDHVQDSRYVAQKILECVAQPVHIGDQDLLIRASVGIAIYPLDAADADGLLRCADQAMYKAKEQGGQCCLFASEHNNTLTQEQSIRKLGAGTS